MSKKLKKAYFSGAAAIVTGASSGIGKEITRILMRDYGMTVLGCARNLEKLQETQNEMQEYACNGSSFFGYSVDVASLESVNNFYSSIKQEGFDIKLIISNAGQMPAFNKFDSTKIDDAQTIIHVNTLGTMNIYCAFNSILKNADKKVGFVVIGSSASMCPVPYQSLYSTSKAGLKAFTECLIAENQNKNLYIGLMMPGMTDTELFKKANLDLPRKYKRLMTKPTKMAAKIVKCIRREKKRAVLGWDARIMTFCYRLAPIKFTKFMQKFLVKFKIVNNQK